MIRSEEHCRDVRNKGLGTLEKVLPLDEWQSRSEPPFNTLQEDAKATSRARKAMRKGIKGEYIAGGERRLPQGVDVDGRIAIYRREMLGPQTQRRDAVPWTLQ